MGEAYLMANGKANSPQGEWQAVCRLLTEPLPSLHSCMLMQVGGSSAGAQQQRLSGGPHVQQQQQQQQERQSGGPQSPQASVGASCSACTSGIAAATASAGPAAASTSSVPAATAPAPSAVFPNLQRMLLDAVALGMVADGPSIELLLQNTLCRHQVQYEELHAATVQALNALRDQKLTTFRAPLAGNSATWQASGDAVILFNYY